MKSSRIFNLNQNMACTVTGHVEALNLIHSTSNMTYESPNWKWRLQWTGFNRLPLPEMASSIVEKIGIILGTLASSSTCRT